MKQKVNNNHSVTNFYNSKEALIMQNNDNSNKSKTNFKNMKEDISMDKQFNSNEIEMNIDSLDGEIWKTAAGFENYRISNFGRVYSCLTHKILKPDITKNNYCDVKIKNGEGKFQHVKIHRLTAKAFLSQPDSKSVVHHLNCDRRNNHIDNLVYLSRADHIKIHKALREQKKKEALDDSSKGDEKNG